MADEEVSDGDSVIEGVRVIVRLTESVIDLLFDWLFV
jgi:hypothetical protein